MDKTTTDTRNKGWEPKDGDVCFISAKYNHLLIFRKFENDVVKSYVNMTSHEGERSDSRMSNGVCYVNDIVEFRPATDWERMYFFDCMAKKGKMWDAENRKVVDYPIWDKKGDVKNSKE